MSGASHPIHVLYEDNHVIVVIKPPNVPTQEDDSRDPDMLTLIKADLKERHQKPGNVFLGLVHRLDRPVGGVMVFAKTSKAASRLSDAVRTRSIRKEYTAVLHNRPAQPQGTLKHHLLKDTKTNRVAVVPQSNPGAKEAILDYRVLGHQDGLSLVQVKLHTGRPHQIRVQFAEIGCPLVGDQRYGGRSAQQGQQIALWSTLLGFEHPVTKESLSFSSHPPKAYPWNLWHL
ncbi:MULTISPECIES: RluA family pseudouridine synthase [unclassified Paenibacillus]|uniref:RluA family pseudouridine synthase n=1 Tax=unclassified Paenibacillus TaxID=185978 RepID=UPI001AEADA5C|nr:MULTISPECIES: RluA family pseudouridine synthase [unclassified Paenibacillus]MBP1155325.1 23S rRNA pseudouridine1911/1915/1917 synthase [Paenibacillus sp. PvP091]MBP1169291.1 23S rRNA pseudouridine1911/1915/1917 synthase [Paenibacillus sp. PvR098]MBP2440319.1 23S rRNA pseudouridine1911/1915/1917 synthase [Paenibacillus sp. PvP052]